MLISFHVYIAAGTQNAFKDGAYYMIKDIFPRCVIMQEM